MTYKLACGDVMPGCDAHFESDDRDTLMAQAGAHAADVHDVTEITPEVRETIEGNIVSA